jgi:methionine synthase II (cobalamin-independent)
MQSPVWKFPLETESRQRCARSKRKLVTQALREAYRRHVRDAITRQAVRHELGV